jgi:hypothetical protein
MVQTSLFPAPFWLVVVAIAGLAVWSWRQRESALRIPMLMVILTVTVWYVVDALYNDYSSYLDEMGAPALVAAWWEVLWFLCAFGFLAPVVHRYFNKKLLGKPSNLLSLVYYGGVESSRFQDQLDLLCRFLVVVWLALMTVALFRTDFDFQGLFMPYFGTKADPWGRGRLGTGIDALLAAAGYFQIALAAAFGVLAALSCRSATFSASFIITLLMLPSYIFDRTRSSILATLLPGFLAWVLIRLRAGLVIRLAILALGFLAVNAWFKFVIENRTGTTIAEAFYQGVHPDSTDDKEVKHFGLNMLEELGFVNFYLVNGSYHPSWGENYFAEIVNPIPRVLWPGKPMIGIDYAIARGQKLEDADPTLAGVGATISTGMIGQGIINFGRILGPVASALLMAAWTAILARQDILAADPWRLFLYAIGLILTFNMGRDITLLVVYPFFFWYLLLFIAKNWSRVLGLSTSRKKRSVRPAVATKMLKRR